MSILCRIFVHIIHHHLEWLSSFRGQPTTPGKQEIRQQFKARGRGRGGKGEGRGRGRGGQSAGPGEKRAGGGGDKAGETEWLGWDGVGLEVVMILE